MLTKSAFRKGRALFLCACGAKRAVRDGADAWGKACVEQGVRCGMGQTRMRGEADARDGADAWSETDALFCPKPTYRVVWLRFFGAALRETP